MAGFESLKVTAEELAAGIPGEQQQPDADIPVVPGTENDPQFQDGDNPAESEEAPSAYDPEKQGNEGGAKPTAEEAPAEPSADKSGDPVPAHSPDEGSAPESEKGEDQKDALQKFMEENGISTKEELIEKLASVAKKPETPEEVERRNRVYRASVDKFAQDNGLITREEILQLENLKTSKAEDVVWSKYKDEWTAAHPDHDKATSEEDARLDFEAQYHLNSENALLKAKGEKMLQRDRDEIVGPLESKYAEAESQYNDRTQQQEQIAGFAGLIKGAIEGVPKEMVFGEGDDKVVFQLDGKVDVKALDNFLVKQDLWEKYLNKEDIKTELNELVEFFVWKTNQKEIASEIRKSGYSAGLKNGSKVGASAPFQGPTQVQNPAPSNDLTAEDRERTRRQFGSRQG